MPRWVSSPFQNFGSRLALVGRPTPNAVKFINIWLDLQLPGRRSNPWAKFLGMPVPCLCLCLSYSNFRNLAQGLHNWWDPLQCGAISQNTQSGPVCWSLDGDLILEPNFWKCLSVCLCLGKSHSHSRTLAQGFLNQQVDPKCGRIPQNDEYEAKVSDRRSNPWAKFLGMPVLCQCLGGCHSQNTQLGAKACISLWEAHSRCSQIHQYLARFAAPWTEI